MCTLIRFTLTKDGSEVWVNSDQIVHLWVNREGGYSEIVTTLEHDRCIRVNGDAAAQIQENVGK